MMRSPEPGDLPVLTALLLPTADREVLKTACRLFLNNRGIFTFLASRLGKDVFFVFHF